MLSLPEGILYIGIPARPDVFSSVPFPSGSVPALPVFLRSQGMSNPMIDLIIGAPIVQIN